MRLGTLADLAAARGVRLPDALTDHWPPRLHATDERGWFRFQRLYDLARSCVRGESAMRRVVTEARLGRPLEESLEASADRMDSPDFAWAVMAIRIQREVGGNLSELLLTVADTMIHRERLRRDIAALTAEGKISAIILGLLPVGLGLFMWMSNPVYMAPLGSTTMGHVLLGLSLVSLLIGFAWMKKIINIKI